MFEKPTSRPGLLEARRSGELNNMWSNANLGYAWFGEDELNELQRTGGYNYLDYAYVTPSSTDHALNVSGGNERIKYFMSGNFMNQSGFLEKLKFKRYNVRASLDATIVEGLTASMQLSTNYNTRQQPNFGGADDLSAMYGKLSQFFFYVPPYINGNLVNPGWIGNPIGLFDESGYNRSASRGLDALMTLQYKIPFIKGLALSVSYSRNNTMGEGKVYQVQPTLYNYKRTGSTQKIFTDTLLSVVKAPYPGVPTLGTSNSNTGSYQFNTQLSYGRAFGQHFLDVMFVSETSEQTFSANNLTRQYFPIITTDQYFATSGNNADSWGGGSESTVGRKSYVGRLNYNYQQKYLLSASLRADGSIIFAPGHRWGYFPAVSAGWKISEEEFFRKHLSKTFRQFKLRASLGYTGNDGVAAWQWQDKFVPAGNAYFGNALQPVIAYGGVVNPNLTWEKSSSTNFGFDLATTFNLTMSLNYWNRNTYDILGSRIVSIPTTFGGVLPSVNYGRVKSSGYELELGYENTVGDFAYSLRGNFGYAFTKVVQRDVASGALDVDNPNGKPLGYVAELVSTGVIRTQKELDDLPENYTIFGAKPVLGTLNYRDISGIDGVPDGKIDQYDRQVISRFSQGTAPYTAGAHLGVAWKGINISAFFQSTFGYKKLYTDNWGRAFPFDASVTTMWGDMWTPDNPEGTFPKFQGPGEPNSAMSSSFWYSDGGYVRLRALTASYSLPTAWLKKISMQRITISFTGTNLFFLSKFKDYDPEIGNLASYPNMKTFNFGLNITL